MVSNQIRNMLIAKKMSAHKFVEELTECNPAIMSYIITGKALPTVDMLKEMCDRLECDPAELYDPKDIDLRMVFLKWNNLDDILDPELGKWFDKQEAVALRKALEFLGYSGVREWIREMWRNTLLGHIGKMEESGIKLSEVILTENRGE